MKIKLICNNEMFTKMKKVFESNGFELSDDPDFIFLEREFQKSKIICQDNSGNQVFVGIDEVILINADSYMNIVILKDNYKVYFNGALSFFDNEEYKGNLIRVNKSQVVNIAFIRKVKPQINSRLKLVLKNEEVVYVSRTYLKKFRESIIKRSER